MVKPSFHATAFYFLLSGTVGAIVLNLTRFILSLPIWGDSPGIASLFIFLILLHSISIVFYRLFLFVFPLREGVIKPGSTLEFTYHVYLLHYLILFYPLIKTSVLPVGLMRVIYLMLGARLGQNSYCAGIIMDPPLTFVGHDTLLGHDCALFAHALEGDRPPFHAAIHIGNHVTVGAKSIIMPGVTIGDHSIVGAGAVVTKGTTIGSREMWAGVPAKKIKTLI